MTPALNSTLGTKPSVSYSVKRDLIQCQKRPNTVSKETCGNDTRVELNFGHKAQRIIQGSQESDAIHHVADPMVRVGLPYLFFFCSKAIFSKVSARSTILHVKLPRRVLLRICADMGKWTCRPSAGRHRRGQIEGLGFRV